MARFGVCGGGAPGILIIEQVLRPLLLGQPAADVEGLWEQMNTTVRGAVAGVFTRPWLMLRPSELVLRSSKSGFYRWRYCIQHIHTWAPIPPRWAGRALNG